MITYFEKRHNSLSYRILSAFIAFTFIFSLVLPPGYAQLIPQSLLNLPAPGTMVPLTNGFIPTLMTGVTIHPDNPLRFDFIMDRGQSDLSGEPLKEEYKRMIKYFMASLTVPEDQLWVNLSPYEKDRMVPQGLGDTEMGRDMLAQDYLLKQLTASLMYPEKELGKEFWNKVYKEAKEKFGTAEIPVNTFNKVWIVPDEAVVYEQGTSAFVIKGRLKVMLESDYEAMQQASKMEDGGWKGENRSSILDSESSIIKEIIIPAIEKEVNEGKNFANLRQIYNALILAVWYKQRLKDSLLGKVYVDQNKTKGIDTQDKGVNQKIYDQYIESFKKGVYNFIKEDVDPATQEIIPRKYFSGGMSWKLGLKTLRAFALGTLLSFGTPDVGDASALAAAAMGGNKDGVTTEFVDNANQGDIGTAIVVKEGVQPILLAQADLTMDEGRERKDVRPSSIVPHPSSEPASSPVKAASSQQEALDRLKSYIESSEKRIQSEFGKIRGDSKFRSGNSFWDTDFNFEKMNELLHGEISRVIYGYQPFWDAREMVSKRIDMLTMGDYVPFDEEELSQIRRAIRILADNVVISVYKKMAEEHGVMLLAEIISDGGAKRRDVFVANGFGAMKEAIAQKIEAGQQVYMSKSGGFYPLHKITVDMSAQGNDDRPVMGGLLEGLSRSSSPAVGIEAWDERQWAERIQGILDTADGSLREANLKVLLGLLRVSNNGRSLNSVILASANALNALSLEKTKMEAAESASRQEIIHKIRSAAMERVKTLASGTAVSSPLSTEEGARRIDNLFDGLREMGGFRIPEALVEWMEEAGVDFEKYAEGGKIYDNESFKPGENVALWLGGNRAVAMTKDNLQRMTKDLIEKDPGTAGYFLEEMEAAAAHFQARASVRDRIDSLVKQQEELKKKNEYARGVIAGIEGEIREKTDRIKDLSAEDHEELRNKKAEWQSALREIADLQMELSGVEKKLRELREEGYVEGKIEELGFLSTPEEIAVVRDLIRTAADGQNFEGDPEAVALARTLTYESKQMRFEDGFLVGFKGQPIFKYQTPWRDPSHPSETYKEIYKVNGKPPVYFASGIIYLEIAGETGYLLRMQKGIGSEVFYVKRISPQEFDREKARSSSPAGAVSKPLEQSRPSKFGTSGDRGLIGKDFNFPLIRKLAQGTALYARENYPGKKTLIGRDTRKMNPEFQKETAMIHTGNGRRVIVLEDESIPTPVLAFYAGTRDEIGGVINLTASHSPYTDGGFKFSPSHGGAADQQVTDRIQELSNGATDYKSIDYEEAKESGLIEVVTAQDAVNQYVHGYLMPILRETGALHDIVDYIKSHPDFELVLDPMQGTGVRVMQTLYGAIAQAAGRDFFVVINENNRDPEFKDVNGAPQPDKSTSNGKLVQKVREKKGRFGLSVDGDVDRFGTVDFGGEFFGANDLIALLAFFLKKDIGLDGAIGKTVATSDFVNAVAEYLKSELDEEKVGFKWFVRNMINGRKYLVAGEESAHVAVGPFMKTFDDGFAVGLTALWLVARSNMSLAEYKNKVESTIGKKFLAKPGTIRRADIDAKQGTINIVREVNDELSQGKQAGELTFAGKIEAKTGLKAVGVLTKDGVKLFLEGGASVLLRPSGTEPAGKLYTFMAFPYEATPDLETLNRLYIAVEEVLFEPSTASSPVSFKGISQEAGEKLLDIMPLTPEERSRIEAVTIETGRGVLHERQAFIILFGGGQMKLYLTPQAVRAMEAAVRIGSGTENTVRQDFDRLYDETKDTGDILNEARMGGEGLGVSSSPAKEVGGIDLNPALLDLQIKRDGNGVPLPLLQQPIENMHIEGFLPIIINVTPIANLPLLLGLADTDTAPETGQVNPALKARHEDPYDS